jgi:hypothetical protein
MTNIVNSLHVIAPAWLLYLWNIMGIGLKKWSTTERSQQSKPWDGALMAPKFVLPIKMGMSLSEGLKGIENGANNIPIKYHSFAGLRVQKNF